MQPGDEVVIVYKGEDALGIVERCDPELDSVLVSLTLTSGARIQTVRRLAECLPRSVAEAAAAAAAAAGDNENDIEDEQEVAVENADDYDDEFDIDIDASHVVGPAQSSGSRPALPIQDSSNCRHADQQPALHMYSCSAPPAAANVAAMLAPPLSANLALPLSFNVGGMRMGFAVSPLRLSASSSFSFALPVPASGGDQHQPLAVTPPSSLSSSFSGGDSSSTSLLSPLSPRGKCRRIYGVDNRHMWCTQCRWKKACTRFKPTQSALAEQSTMGMQ